MKAACGKVCQEQIHAGFLLIVFVVFHQSFGQDTQINASVFVSTPGLRHEDINALSFFFFFT